jgi:hypothetical protein
MLLKVSDQIAECLERAASAREQAERPTNPTVRANYLDAELRWLRLAESYQFVEQAERYISDADAKRFARDAQS